MSTAQTHHTPKAKGRNGRKSKDEKRVVREVVPREVEQSLMDAGMVLCTHIKNMIIGAINTEELQQLKSEAGLLEQALLDAGTPPPEPEVEDPTVTAMNPMSGPDGTVVNIAGANFGVQGPQSKVVFGSILGTINTWTDSAIEVVMNQGTMGLESAWTTVIRDDLAEVGAGSFQITAAAPAAPQVVLVNPTTGPDGTAVAISGSGFGAVQGAGAVAIGNAAATIVSWSDTDIAVTAVQGINGADVPQTVTVSRNDGQQAVADPFTFTFTA